MCIITRTGVYNIHHPSSEVKVTNECQSHTRSSRCYRLLNCCMIVGHVQHVPYFCLIYLYLEDWGSPPVYRFYCWNIGAVGEACWSPWLTCPWSTMKSVPASVKMTRTEPRCVEQLPVKTRRTLETDPRCRFASRALPLGANKTFLYTVVLSLIGWSRADWNLINLLGGCGHCGIPVRFKVTETTGADVNHYLWALYVPASPR